MIELEKNMLDVISRSLHESGLSTAELSRRLGIKPNVLGKKLRGERSLKAEELLMITYALGIPFQKYYSVSADVLPEPIVCYSPKETM